MQEKRRFLLFLSAHIIKLADLKKKHKTFSMNLEKNHRKQTLIILNLQNLKYFTTGLRVEHHCEVICVHLSYQEKIIRKISLKPIFHILNYIKASAQFENKRK